MKKEGIKKLTKKEKILQDKATTKTDPPKIRELKHKARRYSIQEGIFASIKSSLGYQYISPFAIAINTSSPIVAMFSAIPGILGPISQVFSSRLIESHSRKKILTKTAFLESLMWFPFIIIALLFYKNIITPILPIIVLLTFSVYTIISNMGHPAWFSWMGDIVEEKYRGRWFSKRNLLTGFVSVVVAISASFFLDYMKNINKIMFGFIILFFLAFLARLKCSQIFRLQYEPKIKLKKGDYFSFFDFILSEKSNFKSFSIYMFLLNLSCCITSSLIAIYLLRILEFSYTTYMIIIFAGTIFSLIVLEIWGKFADKYGNYKTLAITSALIPAIPFLWILSSNPLYIILVPSLISGIAWAGFNLAAGNFIYDNVSSKKRSLAVSYHNMLGGIGAFLGGGIGAILIKYLTITTIQPIILIFLIGGVARIAVILLSISQIKEVRKTKKFKGTKAIKNILIKETKPILIEEAHQIMSIKKYFEIK